VPVFREVLDQLAAAKETTLERLLAGLISTVSCKTALKANRPLTHEEMRHLLKELRLCATPTLCPHGRPIILRLSEAAVRRAFGRSPAPALHSPEGPSII
jgi:DNA mismatch repair protein MutL